MKTSLQLFFLIASFFIFLFVVSKIRKHKLNIDDALVWILWALLLLVFSIFPKIASWISKFLGFQSPSNFILCLFIFFLYLLLFYQYITISLLKERNKELIQKLSLHEYKNRNK